MEFIFNCADVNEHINASNDDILNEFAAFIDTTNECSEIRNGSVRSNNSGEGVSLQNLKR